MIMLMNMMIDCHWHCMHVNIWECIIIIMVIFCVISLVPFNLCHDPSHAWTMMTCIRDHEYMMLIKPQPIVRNGKLDRPIPGKETSTFIGVYILIITNHPPHQVWIGDGTKIACAIQSCWLLVASTTALFKGPISVNSLRLRKVFKPFRNKENACQWQCHYMVMRLELTPIFALHSHSFLQHFAPFELHINIKTLLNTSPYQKYTFSERKLHEESKYDI